MSIRQRIASGLTILVTVVACVMVSAVPAHAARYAGSGYPGFYVAPQVVCRHLPDGTLSMTVPPPAIYATDFRAGGGNDADYVRYRAFLVNYYTGATLQATGYSGWGYATDNVPARFTGEGAFFAADYGRYVIDYRIEWYSTGSWVAHRIDSVTYYNRQRLGPFNNLNSCMAA